MDTILVFPVLGLWLDIIPVNMGHQGIRVGKSPHTTRMASLQAKVAVEATAVERLKLVGLLIRR